MRVTRRNLAAVIVGVASVTAVPVATGQEANALEVGPVWTTLPPTPRLQPPRRSGRLAVDGAHLWWAEFGRARRSTPVLMLHGGLANSNYFAAAIATVVASGRCVIVMDTRGHGRSSNGSVPLGYGQFARDVLALMDHLGVDKVDVVGWSDGGVTGFDLAIHHPARLNRLWAFGANADPSGVLPNLDQAPAFAAYLKRARAEYEAMSPTPTQFDAFLETIGQMWAKEPNFSRAQLAGIAVPTTIAHGVYEEAISRAHASYLADAIPGANIVMLPNVSHFAMLQNPRQFSRAVLDFLDYR